MKVQSKTSSFFLPDTSNQQSKKKDQNPSKKEQKQKKASVPELLEATENFQKSNPSNVQSNMQIEIQGNATHGLTVILKDQNGHMIRQLSGEEFLNLSNKHPLKCSGKIIDYKV